MIYEWFLWFLSPFFFLFPYKLFRAVIDSVPKLTLLFILSVGIIWTSMFSYLTFYYIFIPVQSYHRSMDLTFDTHCEEKCFDPYANLTLVDKKNPWIFARGQPYRITVDLHLPESELNWDQGTFMVRLKLLTEDKKVVVDKAKSAILKYKTPLVRKIGNLFFWPFLLFGIKDDSQMISLIILEDYIDNLNYIGEAAEAFLVIEARKIQIYSVEMRIEAILGGIRYFMVHWPFTSTLFGVSTISFFLTILAISALHKIFFDDTFSKEENELNESAIKLEKTESDFEKNEIKFSEENKWS